MQLDKYSDYALRILIALSAHAPEKLATARIASMYGISNNHLSKIATELAKNGFVRSERGRAGGLTLAMPASDISIGTVLRSLKSETFVAECFGPKSSCSIVPACGLRAPLMEAENAFYMVLDGYTLADVTRSNDLLKTLLSA